MPKPEWEENWDSCMAAARDRMEEGYIEYGDRSFNRPLGELLGEVEEEILDQINWSTVAWKRIRSLREWVEGLEKVMREVEEEEIKVVDGRLAVDSSE